MDWTDSWLDLALGSSCVACARPGRLLCRACEEDLPREAREVRPDPCPPGLVPSYAAAEYADPVRRMILLHKERGCFALARPLGHLLADPVRAAVASSGRTLLVPVPSRRAVVRARGHDATGRIARVAVAVLRAEGVDIKLSGLLRLREGVADQSGLTARERAENLSGRIAVHPGRLRRLARSGMAVTAIVCDDVLTTGSTAREAQRALEAVGVPVGAISCVAATRRRHPVAGDRGRGVPLPK